MSGAPSIRTALAVAQQAVGRVEARALLRETVNQSDAWLLAHGEDELTVEQSARYDALIARRMAGEPVAYILGSREFCSRTFKITPAVLIPRPETELLVEQALHRVPAGDPCRVLDLGTGSGCIGIAIAAERPRAQVTLVELSDAALQVAGANAAQLAPVNTLLLRSHWFEALGDRRFDLIVSNPPYIADGDAHLAQGDLRFEPRTALAAGEDGLRELRHIINNAPQHLSAGGWLLLEHGHDQAALCAELLASADFTEVFGIQDLSGIPRVSGGRIGQSEDA